MKNSVYLPDIETLNQLDHMIEEIERNCRYEPCNYNKKIEMK